LINGCVDIPYRLNYGVIMCRFKLLIPIAMLTSICLSVSVNSDESIEKQFEERYQAWKESDSYSRAKILSHAGPLFTCDEFKEITELGLSALPYIAKKMEQDPSEGYLWKAIDVIAKVKILGEYDRETNKLVFSQFPNLKPNEDVYLYWWREGHKLTATRFREFHSEWKQMKESNTEEAGKFYKKMTNLGLPVLPFMIEEIEKGDSRLMPAVSYLTDGDISDQASRGECIQRWNNIKKKWTIKFDDNGASRNADIKAKFEIEYKAWKEEVGEITPSSSPQYNEHMYEIVKMGAPVLPLIIERMEKSEFNMDFLLVSPFYLISGKSFEKEDWPEGRLGDAHTKSAMYIDWWHNGLKDTEKAFDRYYQDWKEDLAEDKEEEAKEKLLSIKKLGIAAIPFMIEKIKEGDLEFISIISDHTNESLSADASNDECIEWWNENKDKYIIVKDQ
jgi:hypothetical protein